MHLIAFSQICILENVRSVWSGERKREGRSGKGRRDAFMQVYVNKQDKRLQVSTFDVYIVNFG
jgi:hypothetical protein